MIFNMSTLLVSLIRKECNINNASQKTKQKICLFCKFDLSLEN